MSPLAFMERAGAPSYGAIWARAGIIYLPCPLAYSMLYHGVTRGPDT